jgi:hypothetical protein
MPPKQLFIEGDMAHMPGAPARQAPRSPDRMRKAGRGLHLPRYFCAAPSIPMARKLAFIANVRLKLLLFGVVCFDRVHVREL